MELNLQSLSLETRVAPSVLAGSSLLKSRLEHFYKSQVKECIERDDRAARTTDDAAVRSNENNYLRLLRTRLSPADFSNVKLIGRGAFGTVRLVQKRDNGKVFAMKTLKKGEMWKRSQVAHVKSERDAMVEGAHSDWVVQLFFSFQDALNLYLVMEYLPGGDLMNLLIKYDTFSEDVTRFYIAETIAAVSSVHQMGFVHRDIKPDNLLIDARGHIKLSDFGLSTGFRKAHDSSYYTRFVENAQQPPVVENDVKIDMMASQKDRLKTWKERRREIAYSTVGTPDYMSPETFTAAQQSTNNPGYTRSTDYWSVGCIMFECLFGYPPFCSDSPHETYRKILQWQRYLVLPAEIPISSTCESLLRGLIAPQETRLEGEAVKRHPYFKAVPWEDDGRKLRKLRAPWTPHLKSVTDTQYFDDLADTDTDALSLGQLGQATLSTMETKDLAFVGYTYKKFENLLDG
jgi:protein-serine/threonine kinase